MISPPVTGQEEVTETLTCRRSSENVVFVIVTREADSIIRAVGAHTNQRAVSALA